ncbi:MAG: carboxylesterase family protein [Acidobacteriota bacterium]|nr:carboxylesterase family protein [Acidobacteriota bacterium]
MRPGDTSTIVSRLVSAACLLGLASQAPAATLFLPGVANTRGQNGTVFHSNVFVVNPGPLEATVGIGLVPAGGFAAPAAVTKVLPAGASLAFSNALSDLFGLEGTFGTLTISSDVPLIVRGSTVNVIDPAATYGVSLTAVGDEGTLLPGETGHAIWLSSSADSVRGYRTNVNLALLDPDSEAIVTVWDESGFARGSARVASAAPVTWQASAADLAARPDLATGRVTIEVTRGRAIGFTAVVDNVTGDGIAVVAERVPFENGDVLVDGAARAGGLNGTHWTTDLRIFNPGLAPLVVTGTPVGFPSAASFTRTLAPRALVEIADVLGPGGFGLGEGIAGAILLRASGPFLAAGRTRNADPTGARRGGFSAGLRAVPWTAGLIAAGREATLSGLVNSGASPGFRTNIAVLAGPGGASGFLTLRDLAGAETARRPFLLGPTEWRQQGLEGWFGASSAPFGARVDVTLTTGSADAYASVVDNVTGDAVVAPALPKPPPCAVPSIVILSIAPLRAAPGTPVTVSVFAGGAAVRADPGGFTSTPGGTLTLTPAALTTYRLFSRNSCGTGTAALTLDVASVPAVVPTSGGTVRGFLAGQALVYRGIPYAAPPLGALRFRPPVLPDPWTTVRDASAFGSVCAQATGSGQVVGSEDCLVLNVWAPATPSLPRAPVVFWIHGGGNVQGAGSLPVYDGEAFVEKGGVVVVTINYRLSTLGFLAHPALDSESTQGVSGNGGLLDQIAALQWVRRNIAAFGGDPDRVLVGGESAGGADVCSLLASPLSKGLFTRALIESGRCSQPTLREVEADGAAVVDAAGCGGAPDVAACLRAVSAETLVSAARTDAVAYGPNVDGFVLLESPLDALSAGTHHHVPLLVGANADETSLDAPSLPTDAAYRSAIFFLYGGSLGARVLAAYPSSAFATPQKAWIAATTDEIYVCPARRIARAAAPRQTEPVFRYFFTKALDSTSAASYGAYHSLELPFVFGTLDKFPGFTPSDRERVLSDAMNGYWSRFAANGDPNAPGRVPWPRYDAALDGYLELDNVIAPGAGVRTSRCDFWDAIAGAS